jgi:hypothetical protein
MSKQPEALRLADTLDGWFYECEVSLTRCQQASAELRRLHALNAELEEALRRMVQQFAQYVPSAPNGGNESYCISKALAVLKKATEAA